MLSRAISILTVCLALSALSLPGTAMAGGAGVHPAVVTLYSGGTPDCAGHGAESGLVGIVGVTRAANTLRFHVLVLHGPANLEYDVFIRCVGKIGTLTTNRFGVGVGTFSRSTSGLASTFAVDMDAHTGPTQNLHTPTITLSG